MDTIIKLHNIDGKKAIVAKEKFIICKDISDVIEGLDGISFKTRDGRLSYLSKDGFFFGKYSVDEYDMVYRIMFCDDLYITQKNGKYGLINAIGKKTKVFPTVYEEIQALRSNVFVGNDIIKRKKMVNIH